ncbi:CD276 antigen [Scyliorhinus canicula]|uniref:CD276 antigen n=1 Tax=Scyliorhinus canicula TaxID=7830 RepID=UPI0018F69C95|nr:CD276 antigen [Scyliorhinus canicula]XP_038633138.1 CD276 antigen [Scyliorhinus canicula]
MGLHSTTIFLYVVLCRSASFAQSFVTLDCEVSVTGILNEDTKLPCSIKSTKEKTFSFIELSKVEKNENVTSLFRFEADKEVPQNRIKFLHPDSQDVSLLIQNTQLTDQGIYKYFVATTAGYASKIIALKVKAPYSLPKVSLASNITRRMRTTDLICETTGYPLAEIHWFVYEKTDLTSHAKTSSVETQQGLFKMTSILPITVAENALDGNYTCVVRNVEEPKYEIKKHFPIPFLDEPNTDRQSEEKKTKVLTAIFIIVGALAIGIVILAILRFRRNARAARRQSAMPMMSSSHDADI